MPIAVSEAPRSTLLAYMYNLCANTQQNDNNDFDRYMNGHVTQ